MATEFKLPELGENIESGDLVRLMIKPGASIAEGEPVMELETDKAVVEVPSSVTGTIREVRVKEGDKLPLMTFRIYGDSRYYLEVAKINNITNFRKLMVGSKIFFPPIQKTS